MSSDTPTPCDPASSSHLIWLLSGWCGPATYPATCPAALTRTAIEKWVAQCREALDPCITDFNDPKQVYELLALRDAYAKDAALLQGFLRDEIVEKAGQDANRHQEIAEAIHALESLRLECTQLIRVPPGVSIQEPMRQPKPPGQPIQIGGLKYSQARENILEALKELSGKRHRPVPTKLIADHAGYTDNYAARVLTFLRKRGLVKQVDADDSGSLAGYIPVSVPKSKKKK
jgi:hypothetical protein